MSFFGKQPGARPTTSPERPEPQVVPPEPHGLFAYSTGSRPVQHTSIGKELPTELHKVAHVQQCPLCQGRVELQQGLWRCIGRCQATWLRDTSGSLIDLAALPYGICGCCAERQALVQGTTDLICPVSGQAYLLLPEGPRLRSEAAPYGLCQCCQPAMPLIQHGQGLVCRSKPYRFYQAHGQPVDPCDQEAATSAATLAAIDAALQQNTAFVSVNGLFDLERNKP